MTQEQLKAFMSKVHQDKNLQERLKNSSSHDEARAIAREHGHEISTDAELQPLSDGELEEVAGGGWCGNACTNWKATNGMGTGC